ncbi:TlpA family protein disulfide reductase [Pseudoduganella sp. GCM10020061]|uniref:TlpA family protein disulfide reductase n=1 Tax=Pseudoduganella sp. GCM10020061 TaxID=3317345 RepID=UPI003633C61E
MKRYACSALLALAAVGAQAADFALVDTAGVRHSLAAHHGKWVLVNIWATWCSPCVAEMPELDSLARARRDLVVIGLAADGADARRVKAFASQLKVSYPIVTGAPSDLAQFGARAYPTSILYGPDGVQRAFREGRITRAQVEAAMITAVDMAGGDANR